jgi:prolyl 4-hydroxylase
MHKYIYLILFVLFIVFLLSQNKENFDNDPINNINNFTNINLNNPVMIYDDFISNEDANYLINISLGKFTDSSIYATSEGTVDKSARSSSNVYFDRAQNNVIQKIENKIATMLNINLEHLEPLQIVKYEKGQEYKPHYDYFTNITDQVHNQRTHTFLIYLNDLNEEDGGSTHFSKYKIRVFPTTGRCVHFIDSFSNDELNEMSLHAGEPILTDVKKYVLTAWVRKYKY